MLPDDVSEVLTALARAFAGLGARWYVFGAQAVIAAGVPRLTADVDVTVEEPSNGTPALVAALERQGFRTREMGDVATFIAQTRVIPLVHVESDLPVDVVLAGPGIEDDMLSRTHMRTVGASQIPYIDTSDLIALKILAGRDKDLEDVRAMVRAAPPDLVLSVARQRVATLGAALDDSTLVATFDRLVNPPSKRR